MSESLRLAALRDDIAARLKPVCEDWPDELFSQVVDNLASITLRYEGRTTTATYDVRTTDALVNKLSDGLTRSQAVRTPASGLAGRMGSIPHHPLPRGGPPKGIGRRKPDSDA